jgi:hypothetical protein
VGGYGDYRGFWKTVSEVEADSTEAAGDGAVEVSLTYTDEDGSTETETRRIEVEETSSGYLITDDQVVG